MGMMAGVEQEASTMLTIISTGKNPGNGDFI
jgi:hypothetical protein